MPESTSRKTPESAPSGCDGRYPVTRMFQLWVFGFCFLSCIFFHQTGFDGPTPLSRLQLIMALFWEGRLEIDSFHARTPDKAFFRGHYYSDKAPGTVALAFPGAVLGLEWGRSLGLGPNDRQAWLMASWGGCIILASVLSLGLVVLVKLLTGFVPARIALATGLFVVFGTMAWPYVTFLFSHGQVIGCVMLMLYCLGKACPQIFRTPDADSATLAPKSFRHYLFLAGFAGGWALNSEYTAGLIVFGLPAFAFGRKGRPWLYFSMGLAGPAALIPLYSALTVGSPWRLPYSYQASFPEMKQGLYAIQWPDADIAAKLLFSPERGLLFWSPFLAMSLGGFGQLHRKNPRVFWMTYLLPVLQLIVISGRVWDWPAGPSFSARYLAPAVPLLAIPCALGFGRLPLLGTALGLFSVALTALATLTSAGPEYHSRNPLFTVHLPMLCEGSFGPNLASSFLHVNPSRAAAAWFIVFATGWIVTLASLPGRLPRGKAEGTSRD